MADEPRRAAQQSAASESETAMRMAGEGGYEAVQMRAVAEDPVSRSARSTATTPARTRCSSLASPAGCDAPVAGSSPCACRRHAGRPTHLPARSVLLRYQTRPTLMGALIRRSARLRRRRSNTNSRSTHNFGRWSLRRSVLIGDSMPGIARVIGHVWSSASCWVSGIVPDESVQAEPLAARDACRDSRPGVIIASWSLPLVEGLGRRGNPRLASRRPAYRARHDRISKARTSQSPVVGPASGRIALACADEGANIVVADYGVAMDGSDLSSEVADAVVAEITARGGSVSPSLATSPSSTLASRSSPPPSTTGVDRRCRLPGRRASRAHAVQHDEDEWDHVVAVHLKGHFNVYGCVRPDAQAGNGRLARGLHLGAFTASTAQANYSAAKGGIVSLTRSAALTAASLRMRGGLAINANCIAPVAKLHERERPVRDRDRRTRGHRTDGDLLLSDAGRDVNAQIYTVVGGRSASGISRWRSAR